MKKIFVFLFASIIYYLVSNIPVYADCVGQYGQYGQPCPSYAIVIDKMVGKPGTSNDANIYEYVDNLSVSDPRFKPDQVVFFKVKIKNTSTTKLVGMEVKDTVPSYLDPLEGPGSYNANTREITWNAGDFEVDQEKVFYLKMKVLPQANLPADKGLFCVTNFVKANSSNAYDDDTSQLCIEKQVTAASKVPASGPEFGLLLLAGNILGAGIGLKLRKKT
ncbi:MAG: hypothetical protein US40_C0004G0004 [Candidatus Roizmanbacteria bacterium GW2011_GWC2_37_13]|uniref:DUF11 domain-containing protein n=1 Tax=Candidatus Roizmanbacteria bacterium GW2011_GWC2_37_13 TaxID=1618486 RepID=A0A0G0IP66_9BACT|nr:MAG: hypothetical protein US40_C0004G0004 [Candidatus Roizmanbacteria bacterium GW2011_GWC2_37_13]